MLGGDSARYRACQTLHVHADDDLNTALLDGNINCNDVKLGGQHLSTPGPMCLGRMY